MKLKVLKFVEQQITDFHHVCQDENGHNIKVDMMVNGDFPVGTTPESLIGNTFGVKSLEPYTLLAMGVNPEPLKINSGELI